MIKFFLAFFSIFIIDQYIKTLFLDGFTFHFRCISFSLVINYGVAFSMFEFLGYYLKYIQLGLMGILGYFFYVEKLLFDHPIVSGMLFGAAVSNLFDRFNIGGVVDYVYWHCLFNFAIFNFADVIIDLSIGLLLYFYFLKKR